MHVKHACHHTRVYLCLFCPWPIPMTGVCHAGATACSRMALAISGTLTASSHPLSNPASSPRSAVHHDGFSSAALTPDAMAAVQLAATSSDASALHRTLQKQTSHGHPWGAAPLHTAAGPIAGDMFAGAARWEQASAPGSDTGAVGGTPASHQPPLAGADGLHGTMPFGTFRRDASGDELNGVSLRADGQAIHVRLPHGPTVCCALLDVASGSGIFASVP